MALYIKDPKVDALVEHLQGMMDAPTKTEVVRMALEEKIERDQKRPSPDEVLASIHADLFEMFGERDPNFDFKAFSDELYDGM